MYQPKIHSIDQSRLYKISSKRKLLKILRISKTEINRVSTNEDNYIRFANSLGRDIQWPKPILRRAQKRAANLLGRIETPEFLHSARRGRSYLSNARQHVAIEPSVKLDIRKFYQSARAKAVYHFFQDRMLCAPDVARMLTQLMTVDGHLATGGNVSPILSYFTYMDMFAELDALSVARGCKMTCFIDDITFTGRGATSKLIFEARRIISRHRLRSHKTKLFPARQPRVITGVAVTTAGFRVPNKRQMAIADDLNLLSVTQGDEARLPLLRRAVGRMHEAGQIEAIWRERVLPFATELKGIERNLREGRFAGSTR